MTVPGIGRRTAEAVQAAIAEPAEPGGARRRPPSRRPRRRARPSGARPRAGTGETAEVGLVAS